MERRKPRIARVRRRSAGSTVATWGEQGSFCAVATHAWTLGVQCVGKTLFDDSHIVLTPNGAAVSRSIARMSEDKRWDKELLSRVRGTPWNPLGTAAREALTAGGEALQKPASRRRLYLIGVWKDEGVPWVRWKGGQAQ